METLPTTDRADFAPHVRDALMHLYDSAYLQVHVLSRALVTPSASTVNGLTLHRQLVEAIDALRPQAHIPATAPAWRPYLALHLRYVEGLSAAQAAEEMALSPRQYRREHHKGLDALTDRLWDLYCRHAAASGAAQDTLATEVDRLGAQTLAAHEGTDIAAALQGILATLADLAAEKEMQFAVQLPADLPRVWVDRVVLRQILLNVLTHVLDGGNRGTVSVAGQVHAQQVHLCVGGVCGTERPTAGNPSAERSDDRMAVVERLLTMQGGAVSVQTTGQPSMHREDALFHVELVLPVYQHPAILVVDDNPDVIQLFRRYVSGHDLRVIGAQNGQQALDLARTAQPQVILLDVMMPNQDGWELLQHVKHQPHTADIPVVVCSVLRERALALSLGAAAFLPKPVTQHDLLTTLAPYIAPAAPR